ncbi:MAG: hypothetical protein WA624_11085 [Methylocella sp.]
MHDALVWLGFLTEDEAQRESGWTDWFAELGRQRRAARIFVPQATVWVAAERLPQFDALWPAVRLEPAIVAPEPRALGW